MSKREVDIQTAISFLKQITGRQNVAQPKIPQRHQQISKHHSKKNTSKDFQKSNQTILKKQTYKQEQLKVNSKRLYRTALALEQTLQKYYVNDQPDTVIQHKSTQTRLNIYFKQNSRILQRIRNQNQKVRRNNEGNIEEKEVRLSRQFMFTIKDDCRDYISMSIQKTEQKLSKMMQEEQVVFKQMLLVMIDNELKVYVDKFGGKLLRTIRMYEISKVSYNEQPFKCMVISFCRDQSKPAQHLYLRFSNSQDHDKWDRILYINCKLWGMKQRKDKLFLTDFRKEEFKASDNQLQFDKYEVDLHKTISSLVQNRQSVTSQNKNKQTERQKYKQRQQQISSREIKTVSDPSSLVQDDMVLNIIPIIEAPDGNSQYNITTSLRNNAGDFLNSARVQRTKDLIFRSNTNENLMTPRASRVQNTQSIPSFEPSKMKQYFAQPGQPEQSQNERSIKSVSFIQKINQIQPQKQKYTSKQQVMKRLQQQARPSKQKPSKVHQLQKQLENGVYVTKNNFLSNSQKVVFAKDQCISYADQNTYRHYLLAKKNQQNPVEVQRKQISIKAIQKIQTKFKDDNTGRLTITHSGGKKFIINGPLWSFSQWLKLKCAEL